MKTKIIYFVLLMAVTAMLGIQSCGKGSPCEGRDMTDAITVYTIADSIKAKIPYTGWDTLVFVSDAGDTATLYGQGKRTYFKENIHSTSGYCPKRTIEKYENIEIGFTGMDQIHSINVNLDKTNYHFTGCWVNINSNINGIGRIEFILYDSPNQDSIMLNGIYVRGGYIEKVLYNSIFGIIKFEIDNKSWKIIK